jgi:hypothetical protein
MKNVSDEFKYQHHHPISLSFIFFLAFFENFSENDIIISVVERNWRRTESINDLFVAKKQAQPLDNTRQLYRQSPLHPHYTKGNIF